MGVGGISIWQLLIILAIVLILFGGKRLRTLGSDLGTTIRGFREAMKDGSKAEEEDKTDKIDRPLSGQLLDAEAKRDAFVRQESTNSQEKNRA
ncbi:MAG: twin-arginine translocase TatA/TatE family subunit [Gammaproteobacteria bacterium]|nr:twin-arginine translocase TatA/TatE family subunit [Gammaproteobacteria bacterium]MCP5424441.1 twin-arginine translocase TatA/TatE family subunit [Gammaproteobacteria bacterium]MCP5458435.1 twin-arginine translocase TatA/TatE family subunit [Gammaproteobacteria bacterium]